MDNIITEFGNIIKELNGTLFDNKSQGSDNTLENINKIKHESCNISFNTDTDNYNVPNNNDDVKKKSKQNIDDITNEKNNISPGIAKDRQFWLLVFLIFLLLVPGILLGWYCYKHKTDQELKESSTCVKVVNKTHPTKNDTNVVCMAQHAEIKIVKDSCMCPDDKGYYIIETHNKKWSNNVNVLGIIVIVVSIAILYIIVIYIGFLRKNQENNSALQNAIIEFNNKMHVEVMHLKTAEQVFNKQLAEQELEMNKKTELIKLDEIQKYYDHKRKCELKEYELKEKYLNKVVEVANKYIETQKIDRNSKELKIDTTKNVQIDKINLTLT